MGQDLLWLGSHLGLVDELYKRYRERHDGVDESWQGLFKNGTSQLPDDAFEVMPHERVNPSRDFILSAWPLVNAYRSHGHLVANLDPLGLMDRRDPDELSPVAYEFGDHPPTLPVYCGGVLGMDTATLGEVTARLREIYCGSVGYDFMHITSPTKKRWLAQRIESGNGQPNTQERKRMLEDIVGAEALEHFFHVKYPGTKRFSLEGGETLVPLLKEVLNEGGRHGAIEAVLGMAHRGRLNVLCQVMQRKPSEMFAEFEDIEPEMALGGGDVKYHLGYSCDRIDPMGHHMHLSLAFNPSHLEAVDPVVCGRVRAKQRRHGDWKHEKVLGVLIHGDAAFAGQGLVAETLNLSNLQGYRTGGTVHIIVNNQIGFTASPEEARSTPYCTDIAKMIQCPVFHVNSEDVDAVARVTKLAMEYRAHFKSDVVIDMICYRKFGHNEMDEPSFTQPVMYKKVREKDSIAEIYGQRLIEEGLVDEAGISDLRAQLRQELESELEVARNASKRPRINAMRGIWSVYKGGDDVSVPDVDTAATKAEVDAVSTLITTIPDDWEPHPKVARLFAQRAEMGAGERPMDWGMAEVLAYGTLLYEGTDVRLTGQDSARGTFSHRHAMIVDINNGEEYMPLSNLHPEQGMCRIYDSPLSEAGVLGFEFGYSLDSPDALVIWEAQFGDFVNGAQVILDQFIVATEDKWNRLSGVTLLLPHGFEGQGPEHSSGRIERFLQCAAEDNIQVCQPTTPAQMFHLLRRQVKRPIRKPLIIFTPKSLLRLREATSTVNELTSGTFERVLPDPGFKAKKAKSLILCSGRLYYDLAGRRDELERQDTCILRLEQLYPWREDGIKAKMPTLSAKADVVFAQDEPSNMGVAGFVLPRMEKLLGREVRLAARVASASPATGSSKAHALEQERLLTAVFGKNG